MKKIIVITCVIGLMLMPAVLSVNVFNKSEISMESEVEGTTLITEFDFNQTTCVIEVDSDYNIIWQSTDLSCPHDAERLPNGNTLITVYDDQIVIEVDWAGNIVWQKTGLSLPMDAERLDNGNTLISQYGNGLVIEVNSTGDIVWHIADLSRPMDAERLPNGNTLIVEADISSGKKVDIPGRVIEVDSAGNEVWNITGLNAPVDAERLYNESYGNTTLITEHVGGNVTEFDENGAIIWQKTGLLAPTDAERLDSGNTLIAENGANRVIEVKPNGENVWVMSGLQYPVDVERVPPYQPPTIEITNPEEGYFHLRGRPLFQFFNKTFLYGPANIKVNVTSTYGIEKVEFYINGKLKNTISGDEDSYEYRWTPIICGRYTIKTIVYDNTGQNASDNIVLFKWRAHPILILTGFIILIGLIVSISQE